MTELILDIAKEFTRYPGGRDKGDGPYSGQAFRDDLLVPALKENDRVRIVIDGVMGFGSSFLEECFGGLVRTGLFDKDILKRKLSIQAARAGYDMYEDQIWQYITDAQNAKH